MPGHGLGGEQAVQTPRFPAGERDVSRIRAKPGPRVKDATTAVCYCRGDSRATVAPMTGWNA